METVSLKAEAMLKDPEAFNKSFIPDTPEVLFSIKLINHNETARLRISVPTRLAATRSSARSPAIGAR